MVGSRDHRIPTNEQIEKWESIAKGKIQVLRALAGVVASGETASSDWLRKKCGLSAEEWHDHGELLAALIHFAHEKNFLDWHSEGLV